MNDLVAYLLAQAKYRPVATARFAAGEIWRRSRLRLLDGVSEDLPSFSTYGLRTRFAALYPAGALEAAEFASHFPGAAEKALQQAEQIHRHEFEIFGERVQRGAEIDWHEDWKTGYRWPLRKAGQLRNLNGTPGTDVKRPWELGRFHHLLALGKAFHLTRKRRHAEEFFREVRHFLKANPCPQGIHWAMPMEAAIRGVNWIAAGAFFADDEVLDEAFWQGFLRALYVHGRFVYAHREWNPVARGNHYLACLVGLLHLGAFFDDQAEAREWFAFARKEFLSEMQAQVREDGVAHEGSSGYHVFLTEMFLSGALLLMRADAAAAGQAESPARGGMRAPEAWSGLAQSCGKRFAARLEKMFEFIAALAAGREHSPILGDADDGRLLPLCTASADSAAHLLAVGRALFARQDWASPRHTCEEVWWRMGVTPPAQGAGIPIASESAAFAESGYFFFSSARLRGSVRCGPLGINGWANHAHCDQLSVEFAWEGRPVVVDPGTYLYSGDGGQRNMFRSTRYHNSVVVNGKEQNRFWPGLLFRIVDDTRSKTRVWDPGGATVEFHGEHFGYRRVRVARRVLVDKQRDILMICDTLRGSGAPTLEWFFHLAPGIEPEALETWRGDLVALSEMAPEAAGFFFRAAWRVGPMVLLAAAPGIEERLESSIERGWVAPRYGQRVEAAVVRFRCKAKLPASVGFVFAPAESSES
jgi:hypothetical protein